MKGSSISAVAAEIFLLTETELRAAVLALE